MSSERLRLITTNDFYGSYFPHPTSYGTLPGAGALQAAIERLREDVETALWIDCGDFAQGGPLAPSSAGTLGFVAARDLGIDVAAVGNHELDWGERHLHRWAGETGFPLLCANAEIGLPPTLVLSVGSWRVGVIGLTHPDLASFFPDLRCAQTPAVETIRRHAGELRQQGVDRVVVALHTGVDWTWTAGGRLQAQPARLASLLRQVAGEVDAVLGGHTLARWVGVLGGVPFVQPSAFGAEVGVVDLYRDGRADVSAVAVTGDRAWGGIGAGLNEELTSEIIGELSTTLVAAPLGERSLPAAVAEGICRLTGCDVALVSPAEFQTMQPPRDGVFAYLSSGPLSAAMVLRAIPWIDDSVLIAELAADEVDRLAALLAAPADWGSYGPPVVARRTGEAAKAVQSVAVNHWYARRADAWLGREVGWEAAGCGQRDALRAFAAR